MDFQIFAAPSDAPGGISTNLMLRTKADDAGCTPGSTCSSWKDNSAYANNVETYGTMTLQAGNPAHNFQPYFTNFSSSNFFDEQTSSVALTTSQYTIIPTVFTVARVTTAGNVNGRMVGIDNEL
ncbi:MAG: hypothetical protein LBD11_06215 [Candidatus Peribacteria bacterium]|jgi:hypothetical protein|nr:hypothetical protein [Candidatus Peribacteria bacterium]